MDKDNANSEFDFDNPEFSANFYKNIEKALGEKDSIAQEKESSPKEMKDFDMENTPEEASVTEHSQETEEQVLLSEQTEASDHEAAETVQQVGDATQELDDELYNINASLAQQISLELDQMKAEKTARRKRWILQIQSGIALTILCLIGISYFLGFTKPGNNLLLGMGINLGGTVWAAWTGDFDESVDATEDIDYVEAEDLEAEGEEVDLSTIRWANVTGQGRQEEGVYNILLLGEEAIGSGDARGRTDVIIVATLNTVTKKIKLTSLMRDTLVMIPGYKDNKLNVAYEMGGIDLLYETIAMNFDLHLDGCVMVNFENFEKIIDELGGLEIPLAAGEAQYLNSTNYISDPANRNVVEGTQILNGNQVLGYARIRKRANVNGTNNDYGRTERHRIILNAVFEKYKTTSKDELLSMVFQFLPMITTDIDSKNFEALVNAFVDMGTMDMEQLRIPADGAFQDSVKVRGMAVLIPDYTANIDILHSFIFGDEAVVEAEAGTADAAGETENSETTNGTGN